MMAEGRARRVHLKEALQSHSKVKDWRWERIGWGVIVAVLALAALGVFGTGLISGATEVVETGGVRYEVHYDDWNRKDRVTLMVVRVHAPAAAGGELQVAFSNAIADGITIRSTSPSPDSGSFDARGQVYGYAVGDWSQPLVVGIEYLPERVGRWEGTITVGAGAVNATVPFRQNIFP